MRIMSEEFKSVSWSEFLVLLAGLDASTPLGRTVAIRAEKDPEILERFTPEQKRVRNAWRTRNISKTSNEATSQNIGYTALFSALQGLAE